MENFNIGETYHTLLPYEAECSSKYVGMVGNSYCFGAISGPFYFNEENVGHHNIPQADYIKYFPVFAQRAKGETLLECFFRFQSNPETFSFTKKEHEYLKGTEASKEATIDEPKPKEQYAAGKPTAFLTFVEENAENLFPLPTKEEHISIPRPVSLYEFLSANNLPYLKSFVVEKIL